MEKEIRQLLAKNNLEAMETKAAIKSLLDLYSVTKRFNLTELRHILSKCKLVKIKPDFQNILIKEFGEIEYTGNDSEIFFAKYAGQTVNVYEWAGDWWICEDDNFVITRECFELVEHNGW